MTTPSEEESIKAQVAAMTKQTGFFTPLDATQQNIAKVARLYVQNRELFDNTRSPFSEPMAIVQRKNGTVELESTPGSIPSASTILFGIAKYLRRFLDVVENDKVESKLVVALREFERCLEQDPLLLEQAKAELRQRYLDIHIPSSGASYSLPRRVIADYFEEEYVEELVKLYLNQGAACFAMASSYVLSQKEKATFLPVLEYHSMIDFPSMSQEMSAAAFSLVSIPTRDAMVSAALHACQVLSSCIPEPLAAALGERSPAALTVSPKGGSAYTMPSTSSAHRPLVKNYFRNLVRFLDSEAGDGFVDLITSQHQLHCCAVDRIIQVYMLSGNYLARLENAGLDTLRIIERETHRYNMHAIHLSDSSIGQF